MPELRDGTGLRVQRSVRVPMTLTYRHGPIGPTVDAPVVEELEPIGYLRVFRRPSGAFLHLPKWDVLSVDGAPS